MIEVRPRARPRIAGVADWPSEMKQTPREMAEMTPTFGRWHGRRLQQIMSKRRDAISYDRVKATR
jgi:hypothetical protein